MSLIQLLLGGGAKDPAFTAQYLAIAGGGGGGSTVGGAGGAGGYLTASSVPVSTAVNYTVTVGAGGNGGSSPSPFIQVTDGSPSVFSTNTAFGGGLGSNPSQATYAYPRSNIGSGGGGAAPSFNNANIGGFATPGQGNPGGNGRDFPSGGYGGGGGGGAGAAGTSPSPTSPPVTAGAGGAGLSSSITGASVTRAGGGGGWAFSPTPFDPSSPATLISGAGGAGGGGAGGGGTPAPNLTGGSGVNGTSNTGGGGGAGMGSNIYKGGNGGSGIVILRYPSAYVISNPGGGLTISTSPVGSDSVSQITAGTGNISWS